MTRFFGPGHIASLTLGLVIGLAVGLGLVAGTVIGMRAATQTSPPLPHDLPLHALSTHGTDDMAIATGLIDEGMEGLVTLDYQTGELQVYVLSNKLPKWVMRGKHNVLADLKVEKGKKTNFLLVTGASNFIKGGGALTPGLSTIYVCDANSGHIFAYGLRFNRTAYSQAAPSEIGIIPLDFATARTINLGE